MTDLFTVDGTTLRWTGDGETLVVEPWGRDSVRVRSALGDVVDADWALIAQDPAVHSQATVVVDGSTATLTNGRIRVVATAWSGLDWQTGAQTHDCRLAFHDADGRLLFSEEPSGGALKLRSRTYKPLPGGGVRRGARAARRRRGSTSRAWASTSRTSSTSRAARSSSRTATRRPACRSCCPARATASCGTTRRSVGRRSPATAPSGRAESCRQLDYWVTAGATPAEITGRYAEATGHAPMMPEHGLGFWQCKLRYSSQEELLEVAREHMRRGLPLDVIVADFFHWPHMGDYRFEEEFWPDPAAMVAELARAGRRAHGVGLAAGLARVRELRGDVPPQPAGEHATVASTCRCGSAGPAASST